MVQEAGREEPEETERNARLIGATLDGRYRIESLIGEGGMGAVYAAEHLRLKKRVAVKVIHPERAGDGQTALRFAREAMASAHLEHPHVASAIDYGTLGTGEAYLVLQYVRGPNLQERIDAEGALPWREVCIIGAQVADALSAAHSRDIVHRDLKPENILLDLEREGTWARILDFGIAQVGAQDFAPEPLGGAGGRSRRPTPAAPHASQARTALTKVGMVIGTPGYMAPEQAVGQGVNHRADLYSLGVVLWEALTGQRLYDTNNLTALVTRQFSERVPAPSTLAPGVVPKELDALVLKLLSPNADDRPASASSVRTTLQAYRNSSAPDSGRPSQGGIFYDEGPPRRAVPFLRGGTIWLAIFAVGLLLTSGLIAVAAFGSDGKDDAGSSSETRSVAADSDSPSLIQQLLKWGGFGKEAEPTIPDELQPHANALLRSTRFRERRTAARAILAHPSDDKLPEWLLIVAELEAASGCQAKRRLLPRFAALADPRTRPSLERLARTPERGCGFLNLGDCYDCLRSDLRNTLQAVPERTGAR